jgi:prophage regulatory protein
VDRDLKQLRIIRRREVLEVTGLSRATLYRLLAEGLFPRPVRLTANGVGWRELEIRQWLESRQPVGATAAEATRTSEAENRGGVA